MTFFCPGTSALAAARGWHPRRRGRCAKATERDCSRPHVGRHHCLERL